MPVRTSPPDPWSFFDKIYCISIDTRIDRRIEAKKQFSSVGILERVNFIIVTKHPSNPEQGIFDSHIQCLKDGIRTGAEHILIFEDDVIFKNHDSKRVAQAIQFLKDTDDWQGFFFGAISDRICKTPIPSVVRIDYRCLAHAYAINRPFALQLVQETWDNIPYDTLLRKRCRKCFALSPMLAFQTSASSDNKTLLLDKSRRFFGGLAFIQRINEIYHANKNFILISHGILALGIALLLIKHWNG